MDQGTIDETIISRMLAERISAIAGISRKKTVIDCTYLEKNGLDGDEAAIKPLTFYT
jgi:hypothetical protein